MKLNFPMPVIRHTKDKSKLLILKISTLLCLSFAISAFANNTVYSQISVNAENNTIIEILDNIESNTELRFFYDNDIYDFNQKISLKFENKKINQAIGLIFKNELGFRLVDNVVILEKLKIINKTIEEKTEKEEEEEVLQATVQGTVTDKDGNPLPGATIIESGSVNGTISDFDGNFTLEVSDENSTLEISFIGFESQQITANVNENIQIQLVASISGLDDVVVVGYGTAKQKDVTGAISSLRGEAIENIPVSTADKAIQGRIAGVQVIRNGGAPGSDTSIRIRGTGTVNNADPLYIIDGVPTSSITGINPIDIKSIEVLKDASASAIYGTRAANGVVIITTKRGTKGQLNVTVDAYTGISNVVKTLDVLDAPTLAEIKRERYANDGIPVNSIWQDSKYQTQRTNWQDALFGTGMTNNIDLSVSGGSEKSSFLFSLGFYDEQGIIEKALSDRFSLRVNSDHAVNDWLKIGQNLSLSTSENNGFNTTSAQNGLIFSAIRFHPGLTTKDAAGNYSSNQISGEFGDINNPLYEVDIMDKSNRFTRLLSNVNAEISITDDLKFKTNFGYEASIRDSRVFYPTISDQIRQRANNTAERYYDQVTSFLMEYFIQYDKIFAENHSVGFVGGYTEQSFDSQGFNARAIDLPDEDPSQRFLSTGTANATEEYKTEDGLRSIFGRLNYSYKDTYLLTATVRSDESSKFAKDNQQGIFPAASIGWRVSNESFFDDITFMDNLKLTAGWGQLGNQNIPGFQYLARIGRGARYSFGDNQVVGANQVSFANESVTWETVVMTNIGASMTFLDDRLSANFNYFIKDTEDMLLSPPTIGSQGETPSPFLNIGEIRNKGLELELSWTESKGDFTYSIDANAAFVNNEVTKLVEGTFLSSRFYGRPNQELSRTYVGSPIATFYGWRADGLFQTQADIDKHATQPGAKPGDVRFVDINDDDEIDSDDREIIGSPHPKVTYGINTNFTYKAFDLNMFFMGASGLEIYNGDRMQGLDASYPFNLYSDITGRWTGPGTSNSIPRVSTLRENLNHRTSDLFIEKGDYLRLKNITLGYTLPADMIDKIGLSRLRLYLSGQNVFILTDYSGLDPELGLSDSNLQQNVDFAQFPQARTFMLGANISF
jgi:TonB-linked SusC/RagA family outer membrane protein